MKKSELKPLRLCNGEIGNHNFGEGAVAGDRCYCGERKKEKEIVAQFSGRAEITVLELMENLENSQWLYTYEERWKKLKELLEAQNSKV